ncbi:hypothetical protein BDV96DRAFT_593380 [Lophiotrema nucula]|uniref:Uncharacterized protein n=1 Tax=Lophiotrema nucula TaxID=690887 RepID=A0A6A5ZTT7_9PLEO|nr:hypothetical protein BDV96DRAFT_593380 [Lophiotrema nucula]
METPQPPLTPEQRLAREQREKYIRFGRNAAIFGIVACPAVAFLPPRKLDLYTFSLVIGTYLCADHLSTHYTGRDLMVNAWIYRPRLPRFSNPVSALPTEKAREVREQNEKTLEQGKEAMRDAGVEVPREKKGIFHNLWYGNEDAANWKERRMAEERKIRDEGKGYGEVIIEQIWEVWNGGEKKSEDGTEAQSNAGNSDNVKGNKKKES